MASAETKVGLLVLAALGGMGWLSVQTGAFGTGRTDSRPLQSTFTNAEGLLVGSQVKIAGVPVGAVTEITLDNNGQATVHFTVKKNVPLSAQVEAQITTSGLIGEKYVALIVKPGSTGMLPPTARSIPAAGIASPEDMAKNFGKVADDLGAITSSLRQALGGTENAEKLQNIINSFEGFSSKLDTLLGGNEDKTAAMIDNFNRTAKNLAVLTDRLTSGEGVLGQLMAPNGQAGNLFADLQEAAQGLKQITDKINKGEGTIGKLVNDPTVADKLTSSLETLAGATDRLDAFRTAVDLNTYSLLAEDGVSKGNFSVTLKPAPSRYYVLGITSDGLANAADSTEGVNPYAGKNFGHEVKFTAQFAHVFENPFWDDPIGLRLGMKESTGGIGLDTEVPLPFSGGLFQDKMQLSADAYDFSGENTSDSDAPHVDLKAKIGLNLLENRLYTVFGYDNVLDQEYGSPFIGLGYRFQDDDLKYMMGKAL